MRLWDVAPLTPATAIEKICRTVHRNLTTQEQAMYLPSNQAPATTCA